MKQYLDLLQHVLEHGAQKETAPAPERFRCLATKPVLISRKGSRS